MYNKKSVTFKALDEFFYNPHRGTINAANLLDRLFIMFDVEYRSTNGGNGKSKLNRILTESGKTNHDLIMEAFRDFADSAIQWLELDTPYPYRATTEHIREYMAKYQMTEEIFSPLEIELDRLRAEEAAKESA